MRFADRFPSLAFKLELGLLLSAASLSALAQISIPAPGIINTVAGTAYGLGDGGPATSALMVGPAAVAADSAGNLYIADAVDNRVRRVTASTGIIATVAGTGVQGYSGDGGLAVSAELYSPDAVAVDGSGNLYIADSGNNRVRMVAASTGVITTVAGNGVDDYGGDSGLAVNAELYSPDAVALDGSGNLYIADSGNNRVRMVAASTGIITTVAGNGEDDYGGDGGLATSAALSYPTGVTIDDSGNLYIADCGNYRVRMVAASTGVITTVAGNGTPGYSGDGGLATSAALWPTGIVLDSSGNLYIANSVNNRVRMVAASTGVITTVAGNGTPGYSGNGGLATYAKLHGPTGVALDSSGNVYIADFSNCVVRKVTAATGVITRVAGINFKDKQGYSGDGGAGTVATLGLPAGVAVDNSGNLYIADYLDNVIRKVTASTGVITTVAGDGVEGFSGDGGPATAAELDSPYGVAVDNSGNIYIADYLNQRIRMVAGSTGIITTVAGDGSVCFAGCYGDGGLATSAEVSYPTGMAVDGSGNIYVAELATHTIRMVSASTGIITTVAGDGYYGGGGDGGAAVDAELYLPYGVAVDSSGNIYIADLSERIRMVTASTGVITTVAGNGTLGYSGDGGPAINAQLWQTEGVAVDSSGNIYIIDWANDRIRRVAASTGIITTVWQVMALLASLAMVGPRSTQK